MSNLPEPLIRPARPADGPAVLDLARGLATTFPVDADPFGSTFADVLDSPGATLLVAELGDRVLGYLLGFDHPSFFANGPVAWVEELAVQAGHRRHGLGSLLMEAFEVEVRGRGVRLVALATTRAGGFYLAIGYTEHAAYFRKLL
ncbi:MAG: GNAT family N-acetyltransferase [Pseudonocardia sp.]